MTRPSTSALRILAALIGMGIVSGLLAVQAAPAQEASGNPEGSGPSFTSSVDWRNSIVAIDAKIDLDSSTSLLPTARFRAEQKIAQAAASMLQSALFGIPVNSFDTVGSLALANPDFLRSVTGMLTESNKRYSALSTDLKSLTVRYQIPLFPDLASLVPLPVRPNPPVPALGYVATTKYSGIIVYAKGELPVHGERRSAHLAPCLFPGIWSEDMTPVAAADAVDPDVLKAQGVAAYADTPDEKPFVDRIGYNPLRIVAVGVFGKNSTDVIIPDENARQILARQDNIDLVTGGGSSSSPICRRSLLRRLHKEEMMFKSLKEGAVAVALVVLLGAAFAACTPSKIGYGVVIWSPDEGVVKTGDIVTVRSESKIDQTYTIVRPATTAGARKSSTGASAAKASSPAITSQAATWRVRLFKSEREAVAFANTFMSYVSLYGTAKSAGVPIRAAADPGSQRIYRLRDGQVVKLISRASAKATVDGVDGYWYEVMTDDGTPGYCFDSGLQITTAGLPAPGASQAAGAAGGSPIDQFTASVYRPQYFLDMMTSARIDLARFSPDLGLFPDPKTRTVKIVKPDATLSFVYTSITDSGDGRLTFEGTSLSVSVAPGGAINVQYTDPKGKPFDERYVAMSADDVKFQVEKEKNRRLGIYERFLGKGLYSSDYYGSIDMQPQMAFTWSGYSRSVPDVIPADAAAGSSAQGGAASGSVDFDLFLDPPVADAYDGAITFKFSSSGTAKPVSFLYSFASGGLKLTYIPPSSIVDSVVGTLAQSPVNIFFSTRS